MPVTLHTSHMSHYTVVYIQTPHYCIYPSKIKKLQQVFYHPTEKISASNKYAPLLPHTCSEFATWPNQSNLKTPTNCNFIYHSITTYVPVTDMPSKCDIYTIYSNYFICRFETAMSADMCHMNSLQLTMSSGALVYILSPLLACAPGQVFLPHCTYMSHCSYTVVRI